jgi:predicted transcriptional regulator
MEFMTKLLEKAIAKVQKFADEDQDTFAIALLSLAGEETPIVQLDDETRAAVREGLAQAERGEFVSDVVVEESDRLHSV